MNHKQQLIEWLIDDVAPRIQKSGSAHAELLKFANEKNLSPAELEAMGQIFNTAKTIKFLEKSASRGDSFPIVDVPKLVDDYMVVEKKASRSTNPNDALISMRETGGGMDHFPADLFKLNDRQVDEDSEDQVLEVFPGAKAASAVASITQDPMQARREIDTREIQLRDLNQSIFDLNEDNRSVCVKWAKSFRRDTGLDFAKIEADAIKVSGMDVKSATDRVASYVEASNHIKLARAQDGGPERLVDTRHGFVQDIQFFADNDKKIKALGEKSASLEAEIEERRTVIKSATGAVAEPPQASAATKAKWENADYSKSKQENSSGSKSEKSDKPYKDPASKEKKQTSLTHVATI